MYFFVVVVVRCGVAAVGSSLGKNDKAKAQSLQRLMLWMIIFISFAIAVPVCLTTNTNLEQLKLVTDSQLGGAQNTRYMQDAVAQYVNWTAISMFLYGIGMLYQPLFSTYKRTFQQAFAALVGFVIIMIGVPCYVVGTAGPGQDFAYVVQRANIVGLFVDLYYLGIVLFFVAYCLFPRMITYRTLNPKLLVNPWYVENTQRAFSQFAVSSEKEVWRTKGFYLATVANPCTAFNFFSSGFWFKWEDVKLLFYLGWATFIDQVVWSIANVFQIIYTVNVSSNAWGVYNQAVKPAGLLNNYVYSVANSFAILPSAFVAYELGLGNREAAKRNGWRLYWWGMCTATILMLVVFVLSSFMPATTLNYNSLDQVFGAGSSSDAALRASMLGLSVGLTMIFGVSVLFNSAYQITLNILFCGGNR